MSRVPTIALIAFGGLAAAGVAALQLDLSWLRALMDPAGQPAGTAATKTALPATTTGVTALVGGLERPSVAGQASTATPEKPVATFDIARIDPNGSSVFAGRAAPNAAVTVIANGQVIATVKADNSGEWAAVTERRIEAGPNQLALVVKRPENEAAQQGQAVSVDVAPGKSVAVPPETLATASIPGRPAKGDIRLASAQPDAITLPAGAAKPQPITFVFREATMTEEGRRAASQLAEFLKRNQLASVTLSGHADERGPDQANVELSRARAEAVAAHLRKSGYTGKVDLMAKGKSEPYAGIDRRAAPREQIWQMDRRVEMRVQ